MTVPAPIAEQEAARLADILDAVRNYAETITGDGITTDFAVSHDLGTMDIIVQVRDSITGETILVDAPPIDDNSVMVTFITPPGTGQSYRVIVIASGSGGSGGSGTANHAGLTNLDYASSGHTGFASQASIPAGTNGYLATASGTEGILGIPVNSAAWQKSQVPASTNGFLLTATGTAGVFGANPTDPATFFRRGANGTYTQGTHFTDLQAFLDTNVNNRWFSANITININQPITTDILLYDVNQNLVSFSSFGLITFNIDAQMAGTFVLKNVRTQVILASTSAIAMGALRLMDCPYVELRGIGDFGNSVITSLLSCSMLRIGNAITDNISFTASPVQIQTNSILFCVNGTISLNAALTVAGIFQVSNVVQNLNLGTISNTGFFIDARTNNPLDTFVRKGGTQDMKTSKVARYVLIDGSLGGRGWGNVTVTKIGTGLFDFNLSGEGLSNTNSVLAIASSTQAINTSVPVCFNIATTTTPIIHVEIKNSMTGALTDAAFFIVIWTNIPQV